MSARLLARAAGIETHRDRHFRFLGNVDALTAVLAHFRAGSVSYCRSELTAPWVIDVPYEEGEAFHFVVRGGAWLQCAESRLWLGEGDFSLVSRGRAHALMDAASAAEATRSALHRQEFDSGMFRMSGGGGGRKTSLVCCRVNILDGSRLVNMLPSPLVVRAHDEVGKALQPVLQLMSEEASAGGAGKAAVISRLAEIVITHLLRGWVEEEEAESWVPALRDPQLGRVLALVHQNPGEDWGLERLAEHAGLSRSVFSARFTSRLGISPNRYVTQLRMRLAARWLQQDRLSVAEVAVRLGYRSESAFARAFKRTCGHGPGLARRGAVVPMSGST